MTVLPTLPTLRIRVGTVARSRSQAVFEVVGPQGQPEEIVRCGLEELGLPRDAEGLQQTKDQAFGVPEKALNLLKSAAERLGPSPLPPEMALWLDFRDPRGYLYMLPWERMLAPLGRPLLRGPQHRLRPAASESWLMVALCANTPEPSSSDETVPLLQQLCRVWRERSTRNVRIHVFADALRDFPSDDEIVVHEPPPGLPWLHWIRDAMRGVALDVVHFAAHGRLDHDRGAIALPDKGITQFTGAPEILGLMAQAGAWCLALTGPQGNHSPAGLRELADAVSLAGPYVSVAHEAAADDAGLSQLGDAVATIAGEVPPDLAPMPAVTCWTHPRPAQLPRTDEQKKYLTRQGDSSFIAGSTREAIARDDTPAWVASATRTVESLQAKWGPGDPAQAMDSDAVQALESVASLVAKHVEKGT